MNGWHLVTGAKRNNRPTMHAHEAVGHDHETAARFAAKRGNCGFNFGFVAHRRDYRPHTERPRRSLEGWSEIVSAARCGIRVEHQRDPRHLWRRLPEQLEPFASHRSFDVNEASDVAAGSRERRDESVTDWIGRDHEYYRDGLGFTMERGGHRRGVGDDEVRFDGNQLL